jgi:hypothetical protein
LEAKLMTRKLEKFSGVITKTTVNSKDQTYGGKGKVKQDKT